MSRALGTGRSCSTSISLEFLPKGRDSLGDAFQTGC